MMPLSFQPAVPPAPLDGLSTPAQSRDSESLQTLSFGEVLKVEEKKLQHEQETNAQSIAALFVTMQPPVITQSISGIFTGAEDVPNQTNDQTAPAVDSVQSAPTSPQQAAPLPNNPTVTWRTTVFENIVPSSQVSTQNTNGYVSVKKVETKTTNETAPTIKVTTSQPKNVTLNESTESLPDNYESPRPQATLGASMFETSAAKVQRPAIKANIPVTKVVLEQNENNPVVGNAEIGIDQKIFAVDAKVASDQVTLSDIEGTLPNNSEALRSQKTLPQSDIIDFVSTNETAQPIRNVNVQVTKVTTDHVTLSDNEGSLPNNAEALRSQKEIPQSDMEMVSANETQQPASKGNAPAAKVDDDEVEQKVFTAYAKPVQEDIATQNVTLSDSKGSLLNNSEALRSQKEIPQSDMDIVSENVTPQSTGKVNVQVTKIITDRVPLSDSKGSLPNNSEALRSQQTLPQSDMEMVSANETQQPASKGNAPAAKVDDDVEQKVFTADAKPVQEDIATQNVTLIDSEGSLINNSEALRSQKEIPQSDMDIVSENETPQPTGKGNVQVTKVITDRVPLSDGKGSLPNNSEALRSQQTLPQSDMEMVFTNETQQPAGKVNVQVPKVTTDRVPLSDSEGSLPNNSEILRSQKTLPQSDMKIVSTNETPQPASKVNVPVASVDDNEVEVEQKVFTADAKPVQENIAQQKVPRDGEGSLPNNSKTLQSQQTLPQNDMEIVSTNETPQPASKVNVPVASVDDNEVEVEQKVFTADAKPVQENIATQNVTLSDDEVSLPNNSEALQLQQTLPQSNMGFVSANKTPQPASKVNAPAAKVIDDEVEQKVFTADAKPVQENIATQNVPLSDGEGSQPNNSEALQSQKTLPQSDMEMVSTNETPQSASKVNVPAAKVDVDSEVEGDQKAFVFEAKMILTQGDNQSATSDNITAESLLQTGTKPKVRNEAFVLDQENTTASVKPVVAAQSDEKTSPKEIDKKPALDTDPTFAVTGMGRETVEVKAAEKLSTNKIDPFAMDVIEQITSQMKAQIKSGETSIRMLLNPSELGAIEVQVTHTAQGVSVSFITEQASTGQLIESQVNQLRQSLKEAGVQLANLNISQQQQSNQEGGAFRQGQPFMQNPRRDVPRTEPAEERMRPQRIGGLTGEIDYLI